MRIRAKALFEELSYLPVMSMSGRIAAINLLEKEFLSIFNEATDSLNNEAKVGTFNDHSSTSTKTWADEKESRAANLDVSDFVSDIEVRY